MLFEVTLCFNSSYFRNILETNRHFTLKMDFDVLDGFISPK